MPSSRNSSSKGGFPTLGLSETLLSAVTALGYEDPTPVQRETIPVMLRGRDLLAQAATGTGKTAAFALPMIQRLTEPAPPVGTSHEERTARSRRAAGIHEDRPRLVGSRKQSKAAPAGGLLLVPTRELAMQVSEAIHKYADGTGIIVVPLYGGAAMEQQIRALDRGAHIVVATPGRALDHIRRETLRLDGIRVLVLDELAEGDFDDVRAVVTALAGEFDVMDIAAAAVKMAHSATGRDGSEEEIAQGTPPVPAERGSGGGLVRVFVGAGKKAGIRAGDLVGAFAGESGVPSSAIGAIRIAENFSVVEVPEDLAEAIIEAVGQEHSAARK